LNRKLKYILLLICLFISFGQLKATHLVGGFISYQYQSLTATGARYLVTITSYRDCKEGSIQFADNIDVCLYRRDNSRLLRSQNFRIKSKSKVNPIGRTDCPEATNVCLERAIYQELVDLPTSSFGYIVQWEVCCRNTQVNLRDDPVSGQPFIGQTYQTIIPPTNVKNSSPFFSEVPVPYICINDTTEVNNYAVDADGDSLVYKLATPWYGASLANNFPGCAQVYSPPVPISNTDYKLGFNGQIPFGASGIAQINSRNGISTYLGRNVGNYAVAIDLEEYRNGILLSSTRLDLQILVINCTPNNKPTLSASINNLSVLAGDKLCFNVNSNDRENHNITLSGLGDILTGANGFKGNRATFSNRTGRGSVSSEFCWQTSCDQGRTESYLFTALAVDDGCPSKFRLRNFNITVRPFLPTVSIIGPSPVCEGSKNNNYTINVTTPSASDTNGITFEVIVNNGILRSQNGRNLIIDWNSGVTQGTIQVTPISRFGCKSAPFNRQVVLLPSPPKPVIPLIDTVCENTNKIYSTSLTAGFTYRWWVFNGSILGGTTNNSINITWGLPGFASAKLIQINASNCPSDTSELKVWVSKPNTPAIIGRKTVCPNTSLSNYSVSQTNYNSSFQWWVTGGNIANGQGTNSIQINWGEEGPALIRVLETNRFGCIGDTINLIVSKRYDLIADSINGDTNVCEFTRNVRYSVPNTNMSTYNWSIIGGTIVSGAGTHQIEVDWGIASEGQLSMYEVSTDPINNKQCISDVFNLKVHIRPFPIANQIIGPDEFCQKTGDYLYILNGFTNSTYSWTINGSSNNIVGQGNDSMTINSETFGTFNLRVIETSFYGCVGQPVDKTIIIRPKPTTLPIVGDTIICYPNKDNHTYQTIGFLNSTYQWIIDGGNAISPSNSNSININWNGQQNNRLSVIETSEFGCPGDTITITIFYDQPSLSLQYITVNPPPQKDNGIDLYFELNNAPRYNQPLIIQRRNANTFEQFTEIDRIDKNQISYNHGNINTDINAFEYRIQGIDLCGNPFYSNQHTNILLSGLKTDAYDVTMNFTNYFGWNGRPITYDMHRLLAELSPFEPYELSLVGNSTNYSNGLEHFTQCYRIKGTQNGTDTSTWSNEICFDFEPLLFIPNAFSVNNDDLNDQFILKGGALKTVDFKIFNRWGEKLFEGMSLEDKWDGTYKGKEQPQGVYIYSCVYTDFRGKTYSTKGTITLLR
jgi:gliding motility-associated-like protein